MKSRKIAILWSLVGGSAGADRFYLGQNTAGWSTLFTFWAILPGVFYGVMKFHLVQNWAMLNILFFAIPILYHMVAIGRYLIMSDTKFKSQDKSKSKTIFLALGSILIAAVLCVTGSKMMATVQTVDITTTSATLQVTSIQLSKEFRDNESAYRKKYDNRVIEVKGAISNPPGFDLETGTSYIELSGENSDVFGIKCYFLKENSANINEIQKGDLVVVKGQCIGNKLNNCLVTDIEHPATPSNN